MTDKSMLGVAFEVVSKAKEPVSFQEIWSAVVEQLGIANEEIPNKISNFYTSLSVDGRFHNVGENTWGLRSRFTYEQVNAAIDFTRDESAEEEDLEDEFEDDEEMFDGDEEEETEKDDLEEDLDEDEKTYPEVEEEEEY